MQAFVTALGSEDSRQALALFGQRTSDDVNRRLRGEGEVIDMEPVKTRPDPIRRNGHKADATVVMGAESPAAEPALVEEEPEEQPAPKARRRQST
jgi:hypothetical protein